MKNKLIVAVAALTLVLSGGGILVASANQGFWDNVAQRLANGLLGKVSVPNLEQEQVLGAVTGPELPNPNCTGSLCSVVRVQTFIDASTTIVNIPDPFEMVTSTNTDVVLHSNGTGESYTGATSTVDLVRLEITAGSTSSFRVSCGSAATITGVPSVEIVSTTQANMVPTSSVGWIENNLSQAQGALVTAGTVNKIMLGPGRPFLNCSIVGLVDDTGIINPDNTFAGRVVARFNKLR